MVPNSILLALLGALALLAVTLELVRRRQLREKYAALWLAVSGGAIAFSLAPGAFEALSDALGFGLPVNLLFFVGFLLLLFVSMQLSLEVGRREDETEQLAREVALLRDALAGNGRTTRTQDPGDDEASRI